MTWFMLLNKVRTLQLKAVSANGPLVMWCVQ